MQLLLLLQVASCYADVSWLLLPLLAVLLLRRRLRLLLLLLGVMMVVAVVALLAVPAGPDGERGSAEHGPVHIHVFAARAAGRVVGIAHFRWLAAAAAARRHCGACCRLR